MAVLTPLTTSDATSLTVFTTVSATFSTVLTTDSAADLAAETI